MCINLWPWHYGTFFSMHQCDRCSSDMATWQSIVEWTRGSIQWLQQSPQCSLQQLVKDQKYEIECLLPFSSVTTFQCITDISWSCTQEHRKAPRAPAPATQEEGPGPSLQFTTIGRSCSSNKDASTFQAPIPEAATSSQGPFQQTIPWASQGAAAAFLTCCLVSSTENI